MSYILDALRRADAERERDPARGIHAQPAAALPTRAGRAAPRWVWGAAGGAAVLAVAGWWAGREAAPVPPLPPVPVATRPAADSVIAIAPAAPPVAAAVSPPPPIPIPAPLPSPAPPRLVERPSAKPVLVAAVPAKAVTAPAAAAASAPAAAATAAPAPTAERIVGVADLPADVQRELPKLTISGGVHSENASQRLLIVGGQVMTEGAEIAPGVVLEQIRARTAVMRYRGFKYSVPY
jgi:general secretion pathway protein B